MYIVYHVILLIAYYGIFIHCQGAGGSSISNAGSLSGAISYSFGSISCVGGRCQSRTNIILISFVGGFIAVILVSITMIILYGRCNSQSHPNNTDFINSTIEKHSRKDTYHINPFESGVWSSRYFQYEQWQKPYQILLLFNSQSMNVTGSGSDQIGAFMIDGTFSMKTNRIGLIKTYQQNTGDPRENFGHQITMQLIWDSDTDQFKGKWYLNGNYEQGQCELKYDDEEPISIHGKV